MPIRHQHRNPISLSAICLLVCFVTAQLPAQSAAAPAPSETAPSPSALPEDPTASTIPPAKFKIETVYDQPKFSVSSPILLGTSLACTVVGTILCFTSGNLKPDYDHAYSDWKALDTAATRKARDSTAGQFFGTLALGIGFNIAGVVLTVLGFDQGTGITDLTQVQPVEDYNPVPTPQTSPTPTTSPAAP